MAEDIGATKAIIQEGMGHIDKSGEAAQAVAREMNEVKGHLFGGAEALLEAVKRFKQAEDGLRTAAEHNRVIPEEVNKGRERFRAAGAGSSPYVGIREMGTELEQAADIMNPLSEKLDGLAEQIERMSGLLKVMYEDATTEGLVKGLDDNLVVVNRYAHEVPAYIQGRTDAWMETL